MKSKKYWVVGAATALVMVSSPAVAATLSNGSGQSCGDASNLDVHTRLFCHGLADGPGLDRRCESQHDDERQ